MLDESCQDLFAQMEFSLWHSNEVGNEMFQMKQYDEALIKFNESFQTAMVLNGHLKEWQQEQQTGKGEVVVNDGREKELPGQTSYYNNGSRNDTNVPHRVSGVSTTSTNSTSSFLVDSFDDTDDEEERASTSVVYSSHEVENTDDRNKTESVSLSPQANVSAPQGLLQPLRVRMLMVDTEWELFAVAGQWLSVALMTVMYNGALCHCLREQSLTSRSPRQASKASNSNSGYKNANTLLDLALQVHARLDFDECAESTEGDLVAMDTEEDSFMMHTVAAAESYNERIDATERRQHVGSSLECAVLSERNRMNENSQVALFAIHILKAKLLEEKLQAKGRNISSNVVQDEEKERVELVENCVDAYADALLHAEALWGGKHLLIAAVYSGMGRVLLREGYIQGATVAFRAMDAIYNIPRIAETVPPGTAENHQGFFFDEHASNALPETHSQSNNLSDVQFSSLLLGSGHNSNALNSAPWGFAAAAA